MTTEHADRGTAGESAAAGAATSSERFGSLAAGTRVHTDKGLVAIETLADGDLVLSAIEGDDSPVYRRIARMHVHRGVALQQVSYLLEGKTIGVCVADNLLFCVRDVGWVHARSLNPPDLQFVLKDGRLARCVENDAIRATNRPCHGWVPNMRGSELGTELDFTGQMNVVRSNVRWKRPKELAADSRLKVTTYGVEVEGDAPFFIGRAGILVRT
jgi:hypothetical protein